MVKNLTLLIILMISTLPAYEKLPDRYLISYGSEQASLEIVQYFSLSCPHCVSLFRNDFLDIKKKHIDTGEVLYTFHPVPMDLTTLQFLCCLEKLDNTKKQLLLGVVLEELDLENPEVTTILLKHAMEILQKPIDKLDDEDYLKSSEAFASAAEYIIQEDKPSTIPSIEIEGKRVDKAPEYTFISLLLSTLNQEAVYEK